MKKITFGSIFVFFAAMLFMTGCSDSANNNGKIPDELKGKVYFKAERKNFEKSSKAGESRIAFTQDGDNLDSPILTTWQVGDVMYLYEMNAAGNDGTYVAQFNAESVDNENQKMAYFVIDDGSKDVKFQEGAIYKAIARTSDANGFVEKIEFKRDSYQTIVEHINSYNHVNEGEFKDDGTLDALGKNYAIYSTDELECNITLDNNDKVVSFVNKDKSDKDNYVSFNNPYVLVTLNVKMPSTYNETTDGKISQLTFNLFNAETGDDSDSYQVSFENGYTYSATNGITVHFFILPKTYYNFSVGITAENMELNINRRDTNNAGMSLLAGLRYVFEISGGGNWEEYEGVYLWMLTDTFKNEQLGTYNKNLLNLQQLIDQGGIINFLDDSSSDPKILGNDDYNPAYATYKVDKTAWGKLRSELAGAIGEKTFWLKFDDMKEGFDKVDNDGTNNSGLLAENTNVQFINAPNAAGTLGAYAFASCSKLQTAYLPGITRIESHAFNTCGELKTMTPAEKLTYIGEYAFYKCGNLTTIGSNGKIAWTQTIGQYAFYQCTSLEQLRISDDIIFIGEGACYGCTSLTTVGNDTAGPKNNCTISTDAFRGCTALTTFYSQAGASNGDLTIEDNAFYNCGKLLNCAVMKNIVSIGKSAFSGQTADQATKFSSIIMPRCTYIDDYAFRNCPWINLSIPKIVHVGKYALLPVGASSNQGSTDYDKSTTIVFGTETKNTTDLYVGTNNFPFYNSKATLKLGVVFSNNINNAIPEDKENRKFKIIHSSNSFSSWVYNDWAMFRWGDITIIN